MRFIKTRYLDVNDIQNNYDFRKTMPYMAGIQHTQKS